MKMSLCHPERKHAAKGLCSSCYHKQDYIKEKARIISREHYKNNKEVYRESGKQYFKSLSPEKREQKREAGRRWRNNNHEKMVLKAAIYRAKSKNLDFTIDLSDIIIPNLCPVLGIPVRKSSTGRLDDNSPSLDRVDNTKGYIKGNVIVISNRANRLKGDATPEELYKIAKFYTNVTVNR